MMIQGLWYQQDDSIIYIKLVDADVDSYKYDQMTALLYQWETINKDKPGKHCHGQQKQFSVFYFFWQHSREGSPGRTREIESNHGRENSQTHFARIWLDKWSDYNYGFKIVIMYDPQSSTSQSPAGQEAGLGPGIGNRVGTLNCAQA